MGRFYDWSKNLSDLTNKIRAFGLLKKHRVCAKRKKGELQRMGYCSSFFKRARVFFSYM